MMKKCLFAAVSLLLAALLLVGCATPAATQPAQSTETAPTEEPKVEMVEATEEAAAGDGVVVTDMKGRTVTLAENAKRIVALSPGDCEILFAIGAGDAVIARGEYCDAPEAALALPVVETGSETNVEQILACEPDVVVFSTMGHMLERITAIETAGVPTVASEATDIDGAYQAIEMLGALTGHATEAASLIADMRGAFDTLEKRAAEAGGDGTKTVYFEISPLEYGLWTAGNGTFMNEIATRLKLKNVFADIEGWSAISEEQVLARNPDYIVTIAMYSGEGQTPEEEILQRKGWAGVSAVKSGAVFTADNDSMARPGPRLVDAANALFDAVYGATATIAPAA